MRNFLLVLIISALALQCSQKPIAKKTPESIASLEKVKIFSLKQKATSVYLAGNFNQWQTDSKPFAFTETVPGEWQLKIPYSYLLEGRNEYKFIVDGQWIIDPTAEKIETHPLSGKVGVFTITKK